MTVVPSGLIDLPDVAPILEQHAPPWARPTAPRRSPIRRAALLLLVVVTVLAGASAARDRSAPGPTSDAGPAPAGAEIADANPIVGG